MTTITTPLGQAMLDPNGLNWQAIPVIIIVAAIIMWIVNRPCDPERCCGDY
jgi:hypothetical protein